LVGGAENPARQIQGGRDSKMGVAPTARTKLYSETPRINPKRQKGTSAQRNDPRKKPDRKAQKIVLGGRRRSVRVGLLKRKDTPQTRTEKKKNGGHNFPNEPRGRGVARGATTGRKSDQLGGRGNVGEKK